MASDTERPNELRFVMFEEDGMWIAMCLERYIGTQGRTRGEAVRGLQIVYRAELDHSLERTGKPFGEIPAAPDKFWRMHQSGDPSIVRGKIHDDGLGAGMSGQEDTLELAA